MKSYVALLRGINVGGKNILGMKDLIAIMQRLGCHNVRTYIQSGNVVFQMKAATAKTISDELTETVTLNHGFSPGMMLRSETELADAIERCPFQCEQGSQLHIYFLDSKAVSPDLKRLAELKTESEDFQLLGKQFYLHARDGIGRSKLAANVERCLNVPVTSRNWNTVLKLQSLVKNIGT